MIPESKDTQTWDTKGYPDWNLDLDEAKKHGGRDLLFLVKDPKKNNPGVTNTKLLMGYYLESEDPRENHFRSDSTEISESDIVGWKFFDPGKASKTPETSCYPWYLLDLPGWNTDLQEARKTQGKSGELRSIPLILLVKNPQDTGIFNTKTVIGSHSKFSDKFSSEAITIPDSRILAWKFFDPDQDPRTKNLLEPHEYALLGGLISGLIHNKTIQGSLFNNLHDKLLKIVGINP